MKTNKKTKGDGKANKIQQKPSFKKNHRSKGKKPQFGKNKPKNSDTGKRNQFTIAEERRLDRIREQNERKAEKEAKLLMVKKEKKRKTKIFAKKNHRGQPLMSGRVELLLEKIQKRIANN